MIRIATTPRDITVLRRSLEAVGFRGQLVAYHGASSSPVEMLYFATKLPPIPRVCLWCAGLVAVRSLFDLVAYVDRIGVLSPSIAGEVCPDLQGASGRHVSTLRACLARSPAEILSAMGVERPDPSSIIAPYADAPVPPGVTFLRRAA